MSNSRKRVRILVQRVHDRVATAEEIIGELKRLASLLDDAYRQLRELKPKWRGPKQSELFNEHVDHHS